MDDAAANVRYCRSGFVPRLGRRVVSRFAAVFLLVGCGPAGPKPGAEATLDRAKAAAQVAATDPVAQFRYGEAALTERKNEEAEAAFTAGLAVDPDQALAWDRRGDARLKLGKFDEAVADYDAYLKLKPDAAPHHWRRGIALYYAGRYADGARQFESHQAVNPEDVENAAWHFLCVARDKGVDEARKGLITVSRDNRVPMAQVQKLFAGTGTADDVFAMAATVGENSGAGKEARFFAYLYVGLYCEATGNATKAKEYIRTAAEKYPNGQYMWDVAAAHAKTFK
jgi:lipoprotein NlpI